MQMHMLAGTSTGDEIRHVRCQIQRSHEGISAPVTIPHNFGSRAMGNDRWHTSFPMIVRFLTVAACSASACIGQPDTRSITSVVLEPTLLPIRQLAFSMDVRPHKMVKGTKNKRKPVMAGGMRRRYELGV